MKQRRDITLGEMQAKCVAYDCANCDPSLANLCRSMQTEEGEMKAPKFWDLVDPPRFNEAQMALLKALKSIGVERIMSMDGAAFRMLDSNEKHVSLMRAIGLTESETLDLAELLGKDGAE